MRIISARTGYDCDHSTRDYGYISGIRLFYNYGLFDITFMIPYRMELFKTLQRHRNLESRKRFNKIQISLSLYSEELDEDESEYLTLAKEIREALNYGNLEVIRLLDAYHGGDNEYKNIETRTETGKKLQKLLTQYWWE
ncbi:MAG: hypothetical protein ACLFVP_06020 [Candidatus Bathyarchaeia archaeon]